MQLIGVKLHIAHLAQALKNSVIDILIANHSSLIKSHLILDACEYNQSVRFFIGLIRGSLCDFINMIHRLMRNAIKVFPTLLLSQNNYEAQWLKIVSKNLLRIYEPRYLSHCTG